MDTPAIPGSLRPSDWHLRATLQDLFLLIAGLLLAVLVALEYDIFSQGFATVPAEVRLEIEEALLLGALLAIGLFVFSVRRLAEQRRAEAQRRSADTRAEEAERLAMLDPLTGLANRRLLRRACEEVLARAERGGETSALLLLDLNGFKAVNDRYGHPVGDRLLVVVAQRLRGALPREATVGRLGGDEFAVLCPRLAGPEDARTVARRLVQVIGEPIVLDGAVLAVSAGVGIALSPADGTEVPDLLRHADVALYQAKAAGAGAIRFFGAAPAGAP